MGYNARMGRGGTFVQETYAINRLPNCAKSVRNEGLSPFSTSLRSGFN